MGVNVLEELELRIRKLQQELDRLRQRTDLTTVQTRLDGYMNEIRLLHTGLLESLQQMIISLNAEGVKRYEGAVKAVTNNSTSLAKEILQQVKELKTYVETILKDRENQKMF